MQWKYVVLQYLVLGPGLGLEGQVLGPGLGLEPQVLVNITGKGLCGQHVFAKH